MRLSTLQGETGKLGLSSSSISVIEGSKMLQLTLERIEGDSGPASVGYVVKDGTACRRDGDKNIVLNHLYSHGCALSSFKTSSDDDSEIYRKKRLRKDSSELKNYPNINSAEDCRTKCINFKACKSWFFS